VKSQLLKFAKRSKCQYRTILGPSHSMGLRQVQQHCVPIKGHCYKQLKGSYKVNTHKYFFSNRIYDICEALSDTVVETSSSDTFKRLLDHVDLVKYCLSLIALISLSTILVYVCVCLYLGLYFIKCILLWFAICKGKCKWSFDPSCPVVLSIISFIKSNQIKFILP